MLTTIGPLLKDEQRARILDNPATLQRQMLLVVAEVTAVCVPLIGKPLMAYQMPSSAQASNATVPENDPCRLIHAAPQPKLVWPNHRVTVHAATASVEPEAVIDPLVEIIIVSPLSLNSGPSIQTLYRPIRHLGLAWNPLEANIPHSYLCPSESEVPHHAPMP